MRTLEESEAWAQQHGAVLKMNFAEGEASLQVAGFVAYCKNEAALERALPALVTDLERMMSDRLTQPDPSPEEVTRPR
jgi:hypothetical protein